jgi:hypothetical protein
MKNKTPRKAMDLHIKDIIIRVSTFDQIRGCQNSLFAL